MTDDMVTDDLQTTCNYGGDVVAPKKPRTSEDFYLFCKFILEHEKYELSEKNDDENEEKVENNQVLQDNSHQPTSSKDRQSGLGDTVVEEDSYDLVTCFCKKPFAGRPMIECSTCLTWIHLRCAKVKKSEIPEIFICHNCRKAKKSD